MLELSEQQISKKFESLPENLKEMLLSPTTFETVRRICWDHYLNTEEKISIVSTTTGKVIMGFLHPDDLRGELQEILGVDIRVAASITREINNKILSPIREEIKKVYTPIIIEIKKTPTPLAEEVPAEEISAKEKLIEKVETPTPPSPPPIQPSRGGPFILHKEEALKPILETRTPPAETAIPPTASLAPKPPTAKLEFGKPFGKVQGKEEPRIVHYSNFRTPLKQPITQQPTTQQAATQQSATQQPVVIIGTPPKPPTPPVFQKVPEPISPTPKPPIAPTPPSKTEKPGETNEKVIDLSSFKIVE